MPSTLVKLWLSSVEGVNLYNSFQTTQVAFNLNMSAFEEECEIPAASEVDPAAEFLAKEQVT